MAKQVYYEDISVGMELPPLIKQPTTQELVMWAGASGDFAQIHYDKDIAIVRRLPGVIVHGKLKYAYLCNLLTDWIGEGGFIRRLRGEYRGMDKPGDPIACKGVVTKKYVQDGDHCVECEIWTENPAGERTTPGYATVILPSRGSS